MLRANKITADTVQLETALLSWLGSQMSLF